MRRRQRIAIGLMRTLMRNAELRRYRAELIACDRRIQNAKQIDRIQNTAGKRQISGLIERTLQKSEIKRHVVSDQDGVVQKRNHSDDRLVQSPSFAELFFADSRQFGNERRERDARVHQGLVSLRNLQIVVNDAQSDLNDGIRCLSARRFKIQHGKFHGVDKSFQSVFLTSITDKAQFGKLFTTRSSVKKARPSHRIPRRKAHRCFLGRIFF